MFQPYRIRRKKIQPRVPLSGTSAGVNSNRGSAAAPARAPRVSGPMGPVGVTVVRENRTLESGWAVASGETRDEYGCEEPAEGLAGGAGPGGHGLCARADG